MSKLNISLQCGWLVIVLACLLKDLEISAVTHTFFSLSLVSVPTHIYTHKHTHSLSGILAGSPGCDCQSISTVMAAYPSCVVTLLTLMWRKNKRLPLFTGRNHNLEAIFPDGPDQLGPAFHVLVAWGGMLRSGYSVDRELGNYRVVGDRL